MLRVRVRISSTHSQASFSQADRVEDGDAAAAVADQARILQALAINVRSAVAPPASGRGNPG
jgi:hypothetical protein